MQPGSFGSKTHPKTADRPGCLWPEVSRGENTPLDTATLRHLLEKLPFALGRVSKSDFYPFFLLEQTRGGAWVEGMASVKIYGQTDRDEQQSEKGNGEMIPETVIFLQRVRCAAQDFPTLSLRSENLSSRGSALTCCEWINKRLLFP